MIFLKRSLSTIWLLFLLLHINMVFSQTLWEDLKFNVEEFRDNLDTTNHLVNIAAGFSPSMTNQNPENRIFGIEHYDFDALFRLNFSIKIYRPRLRIKLSPRIAARKAIFDFGIPERQTEYKDEIFINQYLVKVSRLIPRMSFAIMRSNTQWGPAYFGSPSDPFFPNIGQTRALEEIPGKDFFRVLWVPSGTISALYLYNFNEGAQGLGGIPTGEFQKTHALKVKLNTFSTSFNFIGSKAKNRRAMFGTYGQWTAHEAILVYFDSAFRRGSEVLYPVLDNNNPVG